MARVDGLDRKGGLGETPWQPAFRCIQNAMTSKCGDHSAIDFVLAEVIEDLIKLAGQAI
jgi:hypothetical protein